MELKYIITVFATLFSGGVFVALVNKYGRSKKDKDDYLLMLVKQLQENVNSNYDEIKLLKVEVVNWRDKYYAEVEEKNKLAAELRKVYSELRKFNQHQTS